MRHKMALLMLAICATGALPAFPQAAPSTPCPVSYSSLSMPLRHQQGISTPMVELAFTNETRKKIVQARFGLLILDSGGHMVPYDKALTFSAGADPGKATKSEWALEMEKVDIEHMGETVYLKSARFEDNTTWQDDGNERCKYDVYFGPK